MPETLSEMISTIVQPVTDEPVTETESSPKDVVRELKEGFYASKVITDFAEFHIEGFAKDSGEYQFNVESKYLKYACGVLKYTSAGSKIAPNLIKVTIFPNQLKLSGYNQVSFSEIFIPLSKLCGIDAENPVSFVWDSPTLSRIVSNFENSNLQFTYKADKSLLQMSSNNTHLELNTAPNSDWVKYHEKVKNVKPIPCEINVEILQQSLNYLSLFTKKDNSEATLALLECRESQMIGGSLAAIGVFSSPAFKDNPLKIKHDAISVLNKVLPFFYTAKIKLFETESFYILRDQNVYLGIEKTDLSFPNIKHLIQGKMDTSFTVSRELLVKTLEKLSVIVESKNTYIHCKLCGKGGGASLSLVLENSAGRKAKDSILVIRKDVSEKYEDVGFYIILDTLLKPLHFFKQKVVNIFELPGRAIILKDSDDNYSSETLISISKEK